jgi:hypothetical protein
MPIGHEDLPRPWHGCGPRISPRQIGCETIVRAPYCATADVVICQNGDRPQIVSQLTPSGQGQFPFAGQGVSD